jgi:ribosomal subunit interface protein
MKIDFKALTLDLTDDVRTYAVEKVEMVEKLLGEVDEENIRYEVELEKKHKHQTGNIYRADITVFAGIEKSHAVGHGETIFAAIDEAKNDLMRRVRRDKTKRLDFLRRGGAKIKSMLRFGRE